MGIGIDVDLNEAVRYYRLAGDAGYPRALCNLGYLYDHGEGVDVDHHQAFKLYQKAAEANYAPGLYHLALAYEEGNGGC